MPPAPLPGFVPVTSLAVMVQFTLVGKELSRTMIPPPPQTLESPQMRQLVIIGEDIGMPMPPAYTGPK